MSQDLSEEARALIRAGQRARDEHQSRRESQWAALQNRIAEGPTVSFEEPGRAANGAGVLNKLHLGLVLSVLVLLPSVVSDPMTPRDTMPASRAPTVHRGSKLSLHRVQPARRAAAPEVADIVDEKKSSSTAVVSVSGEESKLAHESGRPSPASRRRGARRRGPAEATQGSDARSPGLAEELALLGEARAAAKKGRWRPALKFLEQHRAQFPDGVLRRERVAAQAIVRCSAGRVREASPYIATFETHWPGSVLSRRIEDACAAVADDSVDSDAP